MPLLAKLTQTQAWHVVAATLAALLAVALAGCATPVAQPSVDVPTRFAAARTSEAEPEAAWWDSFGDPVLSDLVRRAAHENRDVKIAAERVRAARAGETISRSWLCPSVGVGRRRSTWRTGYNSVTKQVVPETRRYAGVGARRLVGSRSLRSSARGRGGRRRRHAGGRERRAGRAAAGDDRRRDQLLHARRRAAPARDRARDLGGAGRDAAPRIRATARRARHAVRRRARADRRFEGARGDTAARDARRRLAPPHRGAHRRPGVQRSAIVPWNGQIAVPPSRAGTARRAAAAQARPARRSARSSTPPMRAASRRRRSGSRGCFSARCSGARASNSTASTSAPRASATCAALLAMPIFNAGRTQAINDIAESGQTEAVHPLRGRDRARARGCRERAGRAAR